MILTLSRFGWTKIINLDPTFFNKTIKHFGGKTLIITPVEKAKQLMKDNGCKFYKLEYGGLIKTNIPSGVSAVATQGEHDPGSNSSVTGKNTSKNHFGLPLRLRDYIPGTQIPSQNRVGMLGNEGGL